MNNKTCIKVDSYVNIYTGTIVSIISLIAMLCVVPDLERNSNFRLETSYPWLILSYLIWLAFSISIMSIPGWITVLDDAIEIKSHLFAAPKVLPKKNIRWFELDCYYEYSSRGNRMTIWEVKLAEISKGLEVIHKQLAKKPLGYMEMRHLAETLCKATNAPFRDASSTETVENLILAQDLDLPFHERTKKYPYLLGETIPQPVNTLIHNNTLPSGARILNWKMLTPGTLLIIVAAFLVLLLASLINGLAISSKPVVFLFYLFLSCLILLSSITFKLSVESTQVSFAILFALIPAVKFVFKNTEIEDVHAHNWGNRAKIYIVSDKRVVVFRTFCLFGNQDSANALWLSYEIRKSLASK